MRLSLMVLGALAALTTAMAGAGAALSDDADAELEARARRLLRQTPLIDGHNDVPWQYRKRVNLHLDQLDFASDLTTLDPPMHTDLARLREGGVGGQFWSVFIPIQQSGGEAGDARTVIEQIDFVKRLIARYPDELELALTADEVVRIHQAGKIASLIGMEGGHSIENSLSVLRATYILGARYMTITHSKNTDWADSATDEAIHDGLTEFGREVIREMNRMGMIVDLSHVSPATMHDALDVVQAPVMFSHSSAFAICAHPRNVPDDVLLRVKDNGGVVMITFVGAFVSEEARLARERSQEEVNRLERELGDDEDAIEHAMEAWHEANPAPQATLAQVANHIDHVRKVAGINSVGLGGDYDGTSSIPVGLEDVAKYPDLIVELLRRGYTDDEIRKILGLNVLRVMRGVERAAGLISQSTLPSDARIEELDRPAGEAM
ncbi:MAG: dipeptidase [Phycisphaerales bacterium]